MRRLAVLTLTAGWVCGAAGLAAAQPAGLPLPTGYAATAPTVPLPAVKGGQVIPAKATDATSAGAVQVAGSCLGSRVGGVLKPATQSGPQVWCTDCAPAVRHPLPPAPPGASCPAGGCATAGHDGSCWDRFKAWLCFRQTPVHLGLTPTPRVAPFYLGFPPCETHGYCNNGACGANGCGAHPGGGLLRGHARGAAAPGCSSCPAPGDGLLPGFRFAFPTNSPAPAATLPATPADVIPTAGTTPNTRPFAR